MSVAAPRRIKPTSNTGKPKAAYVYKLLKIKGFEPFAPTDRPYHTEVIDQTEVSLRTDLRGTPITRAIVDGELVDVIWWHGKPTDAVCTRCTIADGKVRRVVRMTRRAKVRGNDRVPTLQDAGAWHIGCLRAKLARQNYGQDVRQQASKVIVSK